jgi:hypothetical protein
MFRVLIACSSLIASGCSVNMPQSSSSHFTDWTIECVSGDYLMEGGRFESNLHYKDRTSRRCEIANATLIALGEPFSISFSFSTDNVDYMDNEWHSIFQIHSFPDLEKNELWRCPILALEVKNGKLRMFNRWDSSIVSLTSNGTCSGYGNSISSRLVFDEYVIQKKFRYDVVVSGVLTYETHGSLDLFVNGKHITHLQGPNAFNDLKGPFFKLGIYKPTGWNLNQKFHYSYYDIQAGEPIEH